MKLAVLSDFDGTITLNDTFENVLERFGKGDWRAIDDQYVGGEIPLVIVSAGLDFVIKHFLSRENLLEKVELCAALATNTKAGIKFS